MTARTRIVQWLEDAAGKLGASPKKVLLERPRQASRGDFATNLALTLAGELGRPPRTIAQEIIQRMGPIPGVAAIEIAGPGFLNFRLDDASADDVLAEVARKGKDFGRSDEGGGRRVMVEFVSANPTGPLHLGHGRQAALGDAIASLLEWTGWSVHREFYFNDAGRQIERLAESVLARYDQLLGLKAEVPEGGYQGDYVRELAAMLLEKEGEGLLGRRDAAALSKAKRLAVRALRAEQEEDLARFGVRFDEYYPETRLYEEGAVDAVAKELDRAGLVYKKDGAVWLRTQRFGDAKDRVMIKSSGEPTYFLPDVAYHVSKWDRGFHRVVNVQGSDHHSTVDRVRAGLRGLGKPEDFPEYVLHQMVTVTRGGVETRFSKRAGSYATLGDLVQEVDPDIARFFFLERRPQAHLSFDLERALDRSEKNVVYKIQYAHARLCSILDRAGEGGARGRAGLLDHPLEKALVSHISEFPETISHAARRKAPHAACEYLETLASLVGSWYHAGSPRMDAQLRVLTDDPELRAARLLLTEAARIVLSNGLRLLKIRAPRRMDREATP